jgi:hypothetical protein
LYDPATGTWSAGGSLNTARANHTATLLSDGNVLVAGGADANGVIASAEIYDPASKIWSVTGSLNMGRQTHTSTLLPSGMVLVAGGADTNFGSINSAEVYDSGITSASKVSGRGSIERQGDKANFTVRANQSGDQLTGSLSFSDPAAEVSIAKAKVRTLTFNGNSADLTGLARLDNGTRVSFSVTMSDISSDGSSDSFSINLSNGYSAGGTLTSGDIKIQ